MISTEDELMEHTFTCTDYDVPRLTLEHLENTIQQFNAGGGCRRIMDITVIFTMWGQSCQTTFTDITEALRWLHICYDRGWLYPVEIVTSYGVVVYDANALLDMVKE